MLIVGSMLLHIFAFNTIYDGFTRKFAEVANIFIQVMTFATYSMTHASNTSRPTKLLGKKNFQPREHLDAIYDLAAKECPKCNNFKFHTVPTAAVVSTRWTTIVYGRKTVSESTTTGSLCCS